MATRPSALRAFREALAATSVRSNPAARKKAAGSPAALIGLSEALQEMARRFLLVEPKDIPDADLVAVLFAGAVEGDPTEAARDLLNDVQGNLARVARGEGFARRKGFSDLALARMSAAAELIKRAERRAAVEGLGGTVTGLADAERIARAYIGGPREQVGALFFDNQLRLLGFRILSMGGQTMTVADPREVVIAALEMRAKVVILVHNHPSGVPSPSGEDDATTARLKEILRLLNMQLADHIILGKGGDTYSYAMSARLNPRRSNPRANPAASDTTGRKPPKGLVVLRYYSDDNNEEMDKLAEKAWKIALASPIRILSNRELSAIALIGNKVVGGGWSAVEHPRYDDAEGTFTFDIVVDPKAQGKGVGDALVEEMLREFRSVRDMGDAEYVLNVEVVNPAMERILARRGFRLRDEEDPLAARGRTMMTRPNPAPPPGKSLAGGIFAGMDLRHMVLTGANLRGADLSNANLSGVNLDDAVLDSANLEGANLTGASLKNASLEDVQLFDANLTEANLEGAILSEGRLRNTNFSRANLRRASLKRVGATEATFEGADLEEADLSRAHLTNADFRGARLRNATMTSLRGDAGGRFDQGVSVRFDNADLMGADLENSRFKDANFTNADLSKTNLQDVSFTECSLIDADLTKANLRGTRFNDCVMRGAVGTPAERVRDRSASLAGLDFAGLDLHGIDFSGRDMPEARFVATNLVGASFVGCDLTRCDFTEAVLGGANFTRAVLREAVFKEARARRADFTKAQMDAVNLDRADVSEANFSDANLRYAQMLMAVATDANFEYTILTGMKGTQGVFTRARFESAYIEKVDFSGARLVKADFSGAELHEVKFNEADLTGARLEDTVVREDVSVVNAKMDAATRALFFVPRSAYGKMAGPILKMDKPDAPTKAAEFKKTYPREFERLKAETGGRDLLPAVKEAIRAKYRSARPWLITRGHYTGQTQRYCGSPNDVLKFNIALDDASFTPAQQDSLRKLAETSRRSGHPHELGDLFTIGWVRYCPDEAERTWLVEEVQSDVSVVRQQLKDEKEFPQQFREVVDILAPIAERFYYDALGVVFELAAEKGYEVEMLDYPAKKEMGSPRSVYTDLPREMGMQKKPKSALEEGAVSGVGAVWAYRPNPVTHTPGPFGGTDLRTDTSEGYANVFVGTGKQGAQLLKVAYPKYPDASKRVGKHKEDAVAWLDYMEARETRKGAGGRILAETLAALDAKGVVATYLHAASGEDQAARVRFFERHGFVLLPADDEQRPRRLMVRFAPKTNPKRRRGGRK